MRMRGWQLGIVVTSIGAAVAALVTLGAVIAVDASGPSCQEQVKASEAKVRTDRWEPADELPGLGDYLEIHWQGRAEADPCSRVPGPTDWTYQGVVRLRPEVARALAQNFTWRPVTPTASPDPAEPDPEPLSVWPDLAPFIGADVRWRRANEYDEGPPQIRWRRVYFDPGHALVLFQLFDH